MSGRVGAASTACDHCGLPVPPGLVDPEAERQFCCSGCSTVFEAIRSAGLTQFYAFEREADDERQPANPSARPYAEYDEARFGELYVRAASDGSASVELFLEGVHCASCVWLVERLPRVLAGVLEVRLDLHRQIATVRFDPAQVPLSKVGRALDGFGYPSHPCRSVELAERRRAEERRHLWRLGVAGACAGNAMLAAFALWGGTADGMEPWVTRLLRGWSLGFTLVAVFGPGRVFLKGALASLRARAPHMDLPVAIALLLGTAWGAVNTVRGTGEVYFESITAVVFLLLVGRWIQHRHQRAAAEAVELLYDLTPSTARRLDAEGRAHDVPLEALVPGDAVEVLAGEPVPADGTVVDGAGHLDLSLLTGEALPVAAGAGDRVHAGTLAVDGRLVVAVESAGVDTRVGRLMQLVEQSARERPPIVRLADALARRFVVTVLLLALATAGLWAWLDPSRAVEQTVALLIVTCPCALGLATPLAVQAAIGRAAARGILIRGGEALERLAKRGTVVLDKTGTLTRGELALESWYGSDQVRPLVRALEQGSRHPVAAALVRGLDDGQALLAVDSLDVQGRGVSGRVDGRRVRVGSLDWIASEGEVPAAARAQVDAAAAAGRTAVVCAVDGQFAAVAAVGAPLQHDAVEAVDALRAAGFGVRVLSGDDPRAVRHTAGQAGIPADDCEGAADPERKLAVITELRQHGPVLMVGDGVNDAAALAAADVGIAVHGGAEASLAAADVYLSKPGIGAVADLVHGARRTLGVIRKNFGAALFYNSIAASLAIAGLISPLSAAVLMPLSSLTVVTLSYRSRTF
ncbi:MAG: heavy metal translocating P-type ATPase [Planctomycetota bacterium]